MRPSPARPAKKTFTALPLAITSLALIGFLLSTYWQQQRDYEALQQELNLTRTNTKQQLEQIGSQAALRHNALVKMSEDVTRLREQLEAMQSNLRNQSDDLSRQGEKLHGKVERIDFETQQQIKTLENIKSQLKDKTDTYMSAMINQERELAKLTAEKAIIAAAAANVTNAPSKSAPVEVKSATPAATPAAATTTNSTPVTPTTVSMPATAPGAVPATLPLKPLVLNPIVPPPPISTLNTTAMNPPSAPLPPVVPDLRGAGASAAK